MFSHPSRSLLVIGPWVCSIGMCAKQLCALWVVEIACETVRALKGPESQHLHPWRRLFAAALSTVVKNVVDAGHAAFNLRHGRPSFLLHRFDWFLGKQEIVSVERRKFAIRCGIWIAVGASVAAF